jgi:hypothetical protein
MIAKEKEVTAIKALQQVIIRGRTMACEKAEHARIADLMDRAEYLVALLYDKEDMTATFRANLVELAELHKCGVALTTFDTDC